MNEQNDRQTPVSDRLFDCLKDFRNRYGGENQVVVVKLGTQPALPADTISSFDMRRKCVASDEGCSDGHPKQLFH